MHSTIHTHPMTSTNPRHTRFVLLSLLLPATALIFTPPTPAQSSPRSNQWQWPSGTPVPIVSSFAPPARDWLPGRRGVTLRYPHPSPVYACDSGTVTFAGNVAGRSVITIKHVGPSRTLWSTYLPVLPQVSVGDHVDKGTMIGHVEEGSETLHWGAKTGPRSYINPIRLTLTHPRLLPWDHDNTAALHP